MKFLYILVMALAQAPSSMGQAIYVSPSGSDRQSGTARKPVQTLHAAQRLARDGAGEKPVTVILRDGDYFLTEPLVLTGEDSGSRRFPVVYRAEHEGKAILSGGTPLKLSWEPYRDGIFKASYRGGAPIDELYIDGEKLRMARYPNFDPAKRAEPYRGAAADAISPERVAKWADPAGGYIHAMHVSLWGGFDYRITGKDAAGKLTYEGGWQNNRPAEMHPRFRMVEGIFEELDAAGEWFEDRKTGTLYVIPPAGCDLAKAAVVGARLDSLVKVQGSRENPVRHVQFDGLTFRHTARTFMLNKEPLLRSDWTIFRGGAVTFSQTEDCDLRNCFIDRPGGNGVFVDNYNRRLRLSGLHIFGSGASAVAFVGDPAAVRNPVFNYYAPHDIANVDRKPGPQSENYPMECVLEDSLIHEVGTVDKQAAGVQISMSRRITVRNCSIYDTSRAGININEGTWGGHLIDGCDVFRTVQETGDHGSFNSWGRDRFWVPNPDEVAAAVANEPSLPFLDAIEPVVIQNSRWRCDHGWDIDLDDGSSNYIIRNNLLLKGGLKLREGYRRIVTNNVIVQNTLHPHVWYPESGDVFTGNVVMASYRPAVMRPGKWGQLIDKNLFASNDADRRAFSENGADHHSVVGDPKFVDPANGDFRILNAGLANAFGFKNFRMDRFGVRKASLKAIAEKPLLDFRPAGVTPASRSAFLWMGAKLIQPQDQELSAYGVGFDTRALAVLEISPDSLLGGKQGLQKGDLILSVDGIAVQDIEDIRKVVQQSRAGSRVFCIVRAQKQVSLSLSPVRLDAPRVE